MAAANHVESSPDALEQGEDSSYPHALASSFAGLPSKATNSRVRQASEESSDTNGAASKGKSQNDFLDLAEVSFFFSSKFLLSKSTGTTKIGRD